MRRTGAKCFWTAVSVWMFFSVACFVNAAEFKMLSGFNDEADSARCKFSKAVTVEFVTEHATEGTKAAKVTCPPNKRWTGFSIRKDLLAGWGNYDYFTFDVFNPSDKVINLGLAIQDDKSNWDDYTTYAYLHFKLFPGANQMKVKTTRIQNQVQQWLRRNLNPNKLKTCAFWFPLNKTEETTLYFDNLALRNNPKVELPEGMRAFDFSSADSDCWPGFTHVTPRSKYSDEAGYGFNNTNGLHGIDDNFDREGMKNGEFMCGSGIYRSPYKSPMTFTVKLAPGSYQLWCAAGKTIYPKQEYTISLNGRQIFKCEAGDRFAGLDPVGRDYTTKSTVWELLAAGQLYDEFTAEVEVKGGKAEITIEGSYATYLTGGLRTLILYPVGNAEAEKALADILRQREEKFVAKWRELKPANIPSPPRFSADEKARGFMLARRHYCETITPYFVPKAEDRLTKLSVAATPGEKEPAVFIVYPNRDAPKVEVQVGKLTGSAGAIPASAVKVEYVHYRYLKSSGGMSVVPSHIVPRNYIPLEEGVPRQFWMTVKVPEDARAGKYTGTVTVTGTHGKASFPLEVEVYPFKLESVADCGLIYAHILRVPGTREDAEAAIQCLVEHNCNSATLAGVIRLDRGLFKKTGKAVVNLDQLDMAMEVMRATGMTGPVPLFDMSIQGEGGGGSYCHMGLGAGRGRGGRLHTQKYFDNIVEVTQQIKARAEEKNYLPVLMYPVTELSNDPNMGPPYLEKLIKAYRRVDNIKLICSLNTPKDIVCAKLLDHMMVNWGLKITEERLAQIRNDGAKLWFQNIGKTRYTEGFLMLKAGAIGRRQFTVSCSVPGSGSQSRGGDPYNILCGGGNGSMFRTVDGAIPNINLKWMSEGADDYRYAHKLLSLIREAGEKGPEKARTAAAEAQKAYDAILARIRIGTAGGAIERDGRTDNMGDYFDKSTYDDFRRTIAEHATALVRALGKK